MIRLVGTAEVERIAQTRLHGVVGDVGYEPIRNGERDKGSPPDFLAGSFSRQTLKGQCEPSSPSAEPRGHTHRKVKWPGAHFPHGNAAFIPRLDKEKRLSVPVPVATKILTGDFNGQFVVRDYQVIRGKHRKRTGPRFALHSPDPPQAARGWKCAYSCMLLP